MAQSTAVHRIAIKTAARLRRSTRDMRRSDGRTAAGGWPLPGCLWVCGGKWVGMGFECYNITFASGCYQHGRGGNFMAEARCATLAHG
jgi:hypothetical protein